MKRPVFALALFATTLLAAALPAADPSAEAKAAFAVGMGTTGTPISIGASESFEQAITSLRAQLASNPSMQGAVAYQAFYFVYGTEVSVAAGANPGELFAEQVSTHLATLAENPAAYQEVLRRAYRHVVGREVYAEEIEYWAAHPTLPYALLVGCVEDWARRNQPGLMNTAGTPTVSVNCELLETLRISPELATEVAAVMGLPAATTVLAAGGDSLKSSGDIRFLVIGTR